MASCLRGALPPVDFLVVCLIETLPYQNHVISNGNLASTNPNSAKKSKESELSHRRGNQKKKSKAPDASGAAAAANGDDSDATNDDCDDAKENAGRSSLLPALRALSASADGKGKVYEHQRAHAGPETTIMSIDKSQTRETAACATYEIQKGACSAESEDLIMGCSHGCKYEKDLPRIDCH
ncbi:hypothetical protein OIU79_006790 [Salix purpurea]|uniref:Uncharacterized protein n=1 Tax=Salix purpurea TaxID=77065 RepID=A0A9Q0Z2L7_SALPP|nr:hypothetical protein OIU79_006790 [Salix purpurea]